MLFWGILAKINKKDKQLYCMQIQEKQIFELLATFKDLS